MFNYKLEIQYKGTNYSGWQIQENAITVQQVISESINTIVREKINLIGSGRTDTGVHALGQVANFRIGSELDESKFLYSLNSILPDDISVKSLQKVNYDFHARFSAIKRSYFYLISLSKSPFYYDYSYHVNWIDSQFVDEANRKSKVITGNHDFTSFAKKNSDVNNHMCEIFNIHWKKSGEIVYFYIESNRFLHGMVRAIAGTIIDAIRLNKPDDCLIDILNKKNRAEAGKAVPAKGLFLYRIKY